MEFNTVPERLSRSKINEFKESAIKVIKYGNFEQLHAADSFKKVLSSDKINLSLMYMYGCPFYWRPGYARLCDHEESEVNPHQCEECTNCWKIALTVKEEKTFDGSDERLKFLCFSVDEFFKILDCIGYQDGDSYQTIKEKIDDLRK